MVEIAPSRASSYTQYIKKLRKSLCRVEPAPLWASSNTQYLLYKAQDPFSACRQSNCSETYFVIFVGNLDVGPVCASDIRKRRINICYQLSPFC